MTFDKIYRQYYRIVFNYLRFKIKDELIAEELASDVMVKVHKKLNTFNNELSSLNTWIMNIAKNTMIDHFRKRTLSVLSLDNLYEQLSTDGDDGTRMDNILALKESANNPEEELIEKELSRTMYDKFEQLNENQKTVAALYFFDGLSYDEIAEQLAMPLGTIKARLHFAREKLMTAVPAQLR